MKYISEGDRQRFLFLWGLYFGQGKPIIQINKNILEDDKVLWERSLRDKGDQKQGQDSQGLNSEKGLTPSNGEIMANR